MMTDEQFSAFVDQAVEELQSKQRSLTERYGLGTHEQYWFDQPGGALQFKDGTGRVLVEARVTPIGSYAKDSNTWRWAWANESLTEALRQRAEELKGLHGLTGFEVFHMPVFEADEQMASALVAMAVHQLGSLGCYRIPTRNLYVFLSIDQIARVE